MCQMDITAITSLGSGFQWLFWFVDFHDLVNLVLTPKPEKTEPLTSLVEADDNRPPPLRVTICYREELTLPHRLSATDMN